MNHPAVYAKAIMAGVVALTGTAATAAADGAITYGEWWGVAAATAVAVATVYGVPNKDPNLEAQDESVQPPEVAHIYRHAAGEDDGPDVR